MMIGLAISIFVVLSLSPRPLHAGDLEADCHRSEVFAGYACLKLADQLADKQNSKAALYYSMACKKGVAAACKERTVGTQDGTPANGSSIQQRFSNAQSKAVQLIKKCSSSKSLETHCVQESKALYEIDPELAIDVLAVTCETYSGKDACLELGNSLMRVNRPSSATPAYMKSCAEGQPIACSMLEAAQKQTELAQGAESQRIAVETLDLEKDRTRKYEERRTEQEWKDVAEKMAAPKTVHCASVKTRTFGLNGVQVNTACREE